MNERPMRSLYSVTEAAQLIGVGRSTMYELVHRGEVSSVRLGRRLLITRPTLEAILGFTPPTPAELDAQQPERAQLLLVDPHRAETEASSSPPGALRRRG
jgi:excisionase family DNA binding protein